MIARRQDALSPERDDAAIILHGRALCGTQPLATGEAMDLAQVCKEIEVSVNIYSECCREAGDEPQPITHLAIDLDAEGEADETMITIRVVPDGREGDRVFGRSLADDEEDSGQAISLLPGDRLVLRPGIIESLYREKCRGNVGASGVLSLD